VKHGAADGAAPGATGARGRFYRGAAGGTRGVFDRITMCIVGDKIASPVSDSSARENFPARAWIPRPRCRRMHLRRGAELK
jgi:hypothetical protein